jgi:hypothetical protein
MSMNMLESMAGFVAHGMTQVAATPKSLADNDDCALLVSIAAEGYGMRTHRESAC